MKSTVCLATLCLATAAIAISVFQGVALASGPIAVYALVEKVTFEPSAGDAQRIRISGVFITAQERTDVYSAPQRGYLYFVMPKSNTDMARREWTDLKSLEGTRQVVGFGSSWSAKMRVRKADEEAKAPDDFAMGNGLVRVNADQPRAKALLDYKDR